MTEAIKMNDKTWRFEDDFVRFFLLVGEEKAVLLDSGVNTPDAKAIAEKYTDLPIMLVNTHGDGDHASGTGAFDKIYMVESDFVNCGLKARFPETELVAIGDGDVIDLGGRSLKIITIPGHTSGSVAVLDVEARVLFSGDSVQNDNIFLFGGHRVPGEFAGSLEKLIAMEDSFDVIVPSHGVPELPGDYTGKVLEAWKLVQSGAVNAIPVEMFGNPVSLYRTQDCGFFCDK